MTTRRILLASLLLLSCGILFTGRQVLLPQPQSADQSSSCCSQLDATSPRQLEFSYYSLREGFNSTLLLVSISPQPLNFILALHGRSGQTLLAPQMTIQPQEKLPVDLLALLTSLGADVTGDFSEGSISIYFSGTMMPLAGQLTMTNPAQSLVLESQMVDNTPGLGLLPPVLNGVWWGLGGGRDARIMVTNASGDAATADAFLDFQGGRHQSAPLTFAAHETKVLSITQLLGDLKASPAQAPEGGLTIVPQGAVHSLVAQGKITDPVTGFSTSLNFMDPSVQVNSALHASGVPIGLPSADSPYAGMGVFVPHVVVRNLTSAPQSVTITVEYPVAPPSGQSIDSTGSGPPTPGAITQQTALAPVSLGPYATVDVALDAAFGMLPLPLPYCSLRIQYSGAPGTVTGEVSSVESKGNLVIDNRLANEGNGWAGSGAHPWHLDDQTESILFLTNMSEQECPIGFRMKALGVDYFLNTLRLAPHETRALNIRKLRDAQKPDFLGHKLPAQATDGTVLWIRVAALPVMGRLVVLQRNKGMASNYDCSGCPCKPVLDTQQAIAVLPSSGYLLVNGTQPYTAAAAYYQDCNHTDYGIDETLGSTWDTDSHTIATVSVGTVTGHAAGTTNARAKWYDYTVASCMPPTTCTQCILTNAAGAYGQATADVQIPKSLSIVTGSGSPGSEAACTTGGQAGCGLTRTFKYQVNDQSGYPIHVGNMGFGDVICTTATNQLNLTGYKTTCGGMTGSCSGTAGPCGQVTDANGQFTETVKVCAPACTSSGSCCTAGQGKKKGVRNV